jgi:glycosyltransferase involved in cell wall biosynthesis
VHIVVLTPVFNDWVSAREVLQRLDAAFAAKACTLSILLVDDGSSEPPQSDFGQDPYAHLQTVEVLKLKKNLGHQRALAVGLCHIAAKVPCDAVVIMDGDGEDDPRDVPRLVARLSELNRSEISTNPIVFAERTRRSESFVFRLGYLGYRILHYLLTGRGIRFGNFSIIPYSQLGALTTEPMLWNHYAASVAGSKLPFTTIPSHRGPRIAGESHLNYVNLIIHGLSALSCYSEIIGVRLLMISSFLFVLSLFGVVTTIILRLFTQLPIPGWTSLFAGLLGIFLLQIITLASNFTLQIISARSVQPFLPARDYIWYVDGVQCHFTRTV